MAMENAKAQQELANEKAYYENQIKITEEEIAMLTQMAETEAYINGMTVAQATDLAAQGLTAQLSHYDSYVAAKSGMEIDNAIATVKAVGVIFKKFWQTGGGLWGEFDLGKAIQEARAEVGGLSKDYSNLLKGATDISGEAAAKTAKEVLERQIKDRQAQIETYKALIQINLTASKRIGENSIFANSTNGAKEATKAVEEYKAKLNELYILEQQLAVLKEKIFRV